MKVSLGTVEISDRDRRLIAARYGRPGLATREQVRNWILSQWVSVLADIDDGEAP